MPRHASMRRGSGLKAVLAMSIAAAASGASAGASTDHELVTLLDKAGVYVVTYCNTFTDIVAEEEYDQTYEGQLSGAAGTAPRRTTLADIVFVSLGGSFQWASFRDVFLVDGHEVHDRKTRLETLFLDKTSSNLDEALGIRTESARFNIGRARTINEPTAPLMFIHPRNQHRFDFHLRKKRKVAGVEVAEVSFREKARPTMIRNEAGDDMPATGRLWIEPESGAVVRSEIIVDLPEQLDNPMMQAVQLAKGRIRVDYHLDPHLGIWVPAQMSEDYPKTKCRASYSNYRRFTVTTMEAIGLPPEKAQADSPTEPSSP